MSDDGWTKARALDLAVTRCLDALEDGATLPELVAELRAAGLPVLLETPELRALLEYLMAGPTEPRSEWVTELAMRWANHQHRGSRKTEGWAQQVKTESGALRGPKTDHVRTMDPLPGEDMDDPATWLPRDGVAAGAAIRHVHTSEMPPWPDALTWDDVSEAIREMEERPHSPAPRVLPFGYAMAHPHGLPLPRPGYRWELTGPPGVTPSLQEWREVPVIGPRGESLGTLGEAMSGEEPGWSTGPIVSVGELAEAHARHSGAVEAHKPLTPPDLSALVPNDLTEEHRAFLTLSADYTSTTEAAEVVTLPVQVVTQDTTATEPPFAIGNGSTVPIMVWMPPDHPSSGVKVRPGETFTGSPDGWLWPVIRDGMATWVRPSGPKGGEE